MAERLEQGVALVPRVRVLLSMRRLDVRSTKHVDEWLLKEWVRGVVRRGLKVELGDKDLVKCGKEMMTWELYVWDVEAELVKSGLIRAVNGVDVIIGGVKLKCGAEIDEKESFDTMRSSWEAADLTGSKAPDTLVIKGVPSRWFAEPRVSTQASVLVTHTVFSKYGKIRNLEIISDEDHGKAISLALMCQIWIQYDKHSGFLSAMRALCGRSMQKDGSTFRANYVVDWDRDDFFNPNNIRKRRFEKEHAQKLANDARIAQAQRLAEEQRRAEEARRAEVARRAEEARLAEEERIAEEERLAEETRRAEIEEQERLARAAEQALREEEERRRKEEEEERIRQMRLIEEQQRLLEEQRKREEEAAQKLVEEKNRQIREATRKLLEEQEQRKKEEAKRKLRAREEEEAEKRRLRAASTRTKPASPETSEIEHGRWQLFLSEGGEPWPCLQQQQQETNSSNTSRSKKLRSVIVASN